MHRVNASVLTDIFDPELLNSHCFRQVCENLEYTTEVLLLFPFLLLFYNLLKNTQWTCDQVIVASFKLKLDWPSGSYTDMHLFDDFFGRKKISWLLLKTKCKFAFSEAHNFLLSNYNCLALELLFISYFVFRRQPAKFFFSPEKFVKWKQVSIHTVILEYFNIKE